MKFNVLLLGPIGTGKTFSTRTLIDCGLELFYLATEPGIETVMGDLPEDKVHWHYVPPAKTNWETLIKNAELVNKMSMSDLVGMKPINRHEFQQFIEILSTLSNFKDDRTGKEFGAVETWGPERALIIDGLSGISTMAMDLVVGAKPVPSQPEWGAAQKQILRLIRTLTGDLNCSFVLISHAEREVNPLTGATHLTVSTLGKAISPDIPKVFDEVIYTRRDVNKFYWSVIQDGVDLKTRTLPFKDDLAPSFVQLFEAGRAKEKE